MLSSIHSAGCNTCHVTHTKQSWVVKGLVAVSSVGPRQYGLYSGREGAGEQVH